MPNSIINLDGLSVPATALINRISDGFGGAFKPYQTKRMAKAEAEAAIITAQGDIEVQEIQKRAMRRFLEEETQKQINIEGITNKAIPHLNTNSSPEKIESDWLSNFFDKSRLISDENMQEIWAKILAGESNKPGSFSKRTINFVANLNKEEAESTTKIFSFCCYIGGNIRAFIYNVGDPFFKENGFGFNNVFFISSLGIISEAEVGNFEVTALPKEIYIDYFDEIIKLTLPDEKDNKFSLGIVLLTPIAQELYSLCTPQKCEGFTTYLCKKWSELGATACSPFPKPVRVEPGVYLS